MHRDLDKTSPDQWTVNGFTFIRREDGRVFQIPAGGEGDDPPADDPPAETPAAQPPPAQPVQSYVTVDQFMQFQQNVLDMLARSGGSQNVQTPTEPEIQEPADEEFDTAALEGRGVGRAVKRAIAAAERRVRRETSAEADQIRNIGLPALANQAKRLIIQGLDAEDRELYDKYKHEIEQGIKGLPPEMQADPDKLELIFGTVFGIHRKEIRQADRERAIRQAREPQDTLPARGAGGRRQAASDEIPDDREIFGAESLAGLRNVGPGGRTIEDIARRLGYKDVNEYRAKVRKYQQEQRGAA